jgi:hypothetical protein
MAQCFRPRRDPARQIPSVAQAEDPLADSWRRPVALTSRSTKRVAPSEAEQQRIRAGHQAPANHLAPQLGRAGT